MTHFEAYHWEDHVPRTGSWKFNLAAGLLALGLIYAALPLSFPFSLQSFFFALCRKLAYPVST